MTQTGAPQTPKPETCDFLVFTSVPNGGFMEIGTVDVSPGGYGSNVFRDLSEFKSEIRPYVCSAGGDAVIAYANGYGMYIKATVLKAVAQAPSAPAQAPAPAPAAAGCQYDAQCKGDRICVTGQCVAPTPKP